MQLQNVPSFHEAKKTLKDLCVAQIIGLLQFRQVPRHPRKKGTKRPLEWGVRKGKWTTTIKKTMHKILARVTPPKVHEIE